jgi:hypothetical protein
MEGRSDHDSLKAEFLRPVTVKADTRLRSIASAAVSRHHEPVRLAIFAVPRQLNEILPLGSVA